MPLSERHMEAVRMSQKRKKKKTGLVRRGEAGDQEGYCIDCITVCACVCEWRY